MEENSTPKGIGEPTGRFGREIDWFMVTPSFLGATAHSPDEYPVKDHRPIIITVPGLGDIEWGNEDKGNSKGPVHMITKLFRQLGIASEDGRMWKINGVIWDGRHDADAIDAVTQEAVRHIWKKLSKTRHHFQGLEKGRNNKLSNKEKRIIKHPANRGRWQMIQADGVHTPWRRRQKAGGDGVCPRCG